MSRPVLWMLRLRRDFAQLVTAGGRLCWCLIVRGRCVGVDSVVVLDGGCVVGQGAYRGALLKSRGKVYEIFKSDL